MPKNSRGRNIAEIIPDKCIACQLCVGECPVNAIEVKNGVFIIDREKCTGCGRCANICPAGAVLYDKPEKKPAAETGGKVPSVEDSKGVAVFIEVQDDKGADVSWELVGKARELAGKLGTQVFGFLLGDRIETVAKDAIAYGCDTIYAIENPVLGAYLSRVYGQTLAYMCEQLKPEILLIGGTPLGRDMASVVATRLGTGLTADCTGLDVDVQQRLLMMTRPTFGGNIMATILCRSRRPQMSTVRPRVMKLPPKDPARTGEIINLDFNMSWNDLPRIIGFTPRAAEVGDVDITKAQILVVIGKGACNASSMPMLEEFARLLGGAIACSRPVVQAGLLPYVRQVGQTGKTVAPKIYVGVAVSGAVQHLVGMQGSEKIIAINTDPHAPLMQIADYPIIGDYLKVVPKLIEDIKARKAGVKG